MPRRRFAQWENTMHQAVADYQSAAMLIMSLDMSSPEEFPDDSAEVYDHASQLYNNAQDLSKRWSSEIPKSDILTTSQFHAYRRITNVIAYTVRIYYDLVPWIVGADSQLSDAAVGFVGEVKKILIFQFAILRDIPAIKRRDIPNISELVSKMDSQVELKLKPIRAAIDNWNPPTRRSPEAGPNLIVRNGWIDGWILNSYEGQFELSSPSVDNTLTFLATSSLTSDDEYNVIRTHFDTSGSHGQVLAWSGIDWVRIQSKASLAEEMVQFHEEVFNGSDEAFVVGGFLHGFESPSGNHFCLMGDSSIPTHEWMRIFQANGVKVLDPQ